MARRTQARGLALLATTAARKAWAGAGVAFLGPIGTYIAATGDWSWRYFAGSVVAGAVAGLGVFETRNADEKETVGG